MASTIIRTSLAIFFISLTSLSFGQKFGFDAVLSSTPDQETVFCVPNNDSNISLLNKSSITIKFSSDSWIFINASPRWIDDHKKDGSLDDYYFEYAPPVALADSSRAHHFVNEVHAGMAPLGVSYTGQNVILGVVDQGIDWLHEDFIDSNGNTRVLRYWDHTMAGPTPPSPYNYGQEWDSTSINNGTCTSTEEASAHGSNVAGIAAGNGRANGLNMGMAPNVNLVIVESDFSSLNWTLTIADAVDYIFKVADEYNMPAVVNLSIGTYFGSHDGDDPAGDYIETLLDDKGGRLVVCAAGNSGAEGQFHQQSSPTVDTNFVWFENNPSAALGANTIFFDLWSDNADATFDFALGADSPSPGYSFRGRTQFHGASSSIGTTIFDTIWNGANRIATMEVYTETVGNNYHMQFFVSNVDSTSYLYRFETVGSGKYDLWSGAWLGYNDMVTTIPTTIEMPDIVNYIMPDSAQTIVSSWNCSEKVVSVGNMKNRHQFVDNNLNTYTSPYPVDVGELSTKSSKGPTRHAQIKPDVTAAGDVTLAAGPLWLLANPAYNAAIDSGGFHNANGGTSMASPVVAGIAALYFQRCKHATYLDFTTDLKATAYTDIYTGAVPNNSYGWGKPHAFDLLQEVSVVAQPVITFGGGTTLVSSAGNSYQWHLDGQPIQGETGQNHDGIPPFGSYEIEVISTEGCSAFSDPYVANVGIETLENSNIKVYPNPTKSIINFESEDEILEVKMVDIAGKSISVKLINNSVDLSSFKNGTYFMHVTTDKGTSTLKIVNL